MRDRPADQAPAGAGCAAASEAGVRSAAVIVAHPDDETLWAGGLILRHPQWRWLIAALCRRSDPDRAPKFARVAACLKAEGRMEDLDDGPDQAPLPSAVVEDAVLGLTGGGPFDLVLTHGPAGEYTRHVRHEEVSRAVAALWLQGRLEARRLWMFAYGDDGGRRLPCADARAHRVDALPAGVWREKYRIVTEVYGFGAESLEARTTPRDEAFWCFDSPEAAGAWIKGGSVR